MAELEKAKSRPSVAYLVARWVSAIVHPVMFPLFTLGVVTYTATRSLSETARWVAIAVVLTTLPISLLVIVQVLRQRWTDLDVSVRRQRYALYPFGIACMVALALVFALFGAPEIAVRAATAVALANAADGLINFAYKVSAHATGAAVCAAVLWAGAPAWGLPATAAALAVGWSRVELRRHTPPQVALGWAVGVASTVIALYLPLGK